MERIFIDVKAFIPGDVVVLSWWSDLQRYTPKSNVHTKPYFHVIIKKGEMGLVVSVDDNSSELLVLFSGSKLVTVHSCMITHVIDGSIVGLL